MSVSRRETRRQIRREAIINVARISFFENGYAGTSMSSIAASVGGSKTTLWSYFPSKEELFAAVLEEETRLFREEMLSLLTPDGRLEDTLRSFCRAFLRKVLSDKAMNLNHLVIAEARRFPELGAIFYERAPKQSWLKIAEYMAQAMDRGQLRRADPMVVARHLLALCQSQTQLLRLWNVLPLPTPEQMDADVELALDAFFRAYGMPAKQDRPELCVGAE
ncbi:TetR/AcrR family transcriptional regulator [Oleisolibacter albus]|uniref:TetR/AcrR family transcriptional regulator n=1 Tax=Oleisolibacter albus TaxID=2171757 RepID=UPI001874223A|nr:TetR/AcrR family transcriptional regulator [Oleisolibacter albus]